MRILIAFAISFILLSCNTKDSVTRFSEEYEMDKEYYVYPSTLRMANLQETDEFNELVENFVVGKYFSISNDSINSKRISELKTKMVKEGYEEAMVFKSKDQNVSVYILERNIPITSAIFEMDSVYNIIQIEGMINILKIPAFLESYDEEDYLNVLDFIQTDQNRPAHEHHSQD